MKSTQILKNVASNYARLFLGIISALLLTPFIIHKVGTQAFGLWALALSVSGFFSLSDFGLTSAAAKYLSHYRALEDWEQLSATASALFKIYAMISVLCVFVGAAVTQLAPQLFHVSGAELQTLQVMMVCVSLVAIFGFLSVVPMQCVIATQKMDAINQALFVGQLAMILLTAIGLSMGQGVLFLAFLLVGSAIYSLVFSVILMRRHIPQLRFVSKTDTSNLKTLLTYAASVFWVSAAGRIIFYADNVVIGSFLSIAAVAGYALVLKIIELIRGVVGTGVTVLGYSAVEQAALNKRESLEILWVEGTKWSLAVTLPISCACILLGPELLDAWVGQTYGVAPLALAILAFAQIFESFAAPSYQLLINTGHHKVLAWTMSIEAIANLALSILLIKQFGIVGVALGTLIPSLIRNAILYPVLMARHYGINAQIVFGKAIIPAVTAAVPSSLAILFYKTGGLHNGRISMCLLILACACLSATACFFACLANTQREKVAEHFASRTRKLALLLRS